MARNPTGNTGGGGGGGKKNRHRNRDRQREQNAGRAMAGLANQLAETQGLDPATAQQMARTMLSNPAVTIGKNGLIHWKSRPYTYAQFADSPLSRMVRGVTAAEYNKAAIEGEAGYMGDMANLDLQQQMDTAGLGDQRRKALIDFGDPGFVNGDPTLANQAGQNPFSIIANIARQDEARRAQTAQVSNMYGTYQGGGLQSGLQEASRLNASTTAEGTRALTDLLSSIAQRQSQADQIHALGQSSAYQAATQRLLTTGGLHASQFKPTWNQNQFHWWKPPAPPPRHGDPKHHQPPRPGGNPNWGGGSRGYPSPHPPPRLGPPSPPRIY